MQKKTTAEAEFQQRRLQQHRAKISSMKSSIDNKPPPTYSHLKANSKKTLIERERVERIEKENYRLLERMTHIVNQKNTIDNKQTAIMPLVTGRQFRRRKELSKIQSENEILLRRLQEMRPYIDRVEMEDFAIETTKRCGTAASKPTTAQPKDDLTLSNDGDDDAHDDAPVDEEGAEADYGDEEQQ